jgi:hypothetical protein
MADDVETFFKKYGPEIEELSRDSRALITGLLPDAKETVYAGWKVVWYSVSGGMKDGIVGIHPQKKHVNLIFLRGKELKDPDHLLEGTGRKGRHIKIMKRDEINKEALKSLILNSAKLVSE